MHIVGTLLWCSRNCYPEISQGVSQLCSVMSKPSPEAFNCALHMIKYLYCNRDRGICFNSDGNLDPLTLYDASNKGDYGDSKVSAGYVVMLRRRRAASCSCCATVRASSLSCTILSSTCFFFARSCIVIARRPSSCCSRVPDVERCGCFCRACAIFLRSSLSASTA